MNYQGFDNIVDFLQMKLQELPLQPHGIIYREAAEYLADALIAAGIGDVKEAELERKAYEVASNQYRIWFEEQKDRAEVAERALVMACANMVKDEKSDVNIEYVIHVLYYKYLKQAEKELAEGRK